MPTALETDAGLENLRLNHEEYAQRKTELRSYPYFIQIGADHRCNLKCGFCMAASDRERGIVHIQDRKLERNAIEIFQRLSPFIRYWRYLSLTGPGESLLNPRLAEIVELVRHHSPQCVLVITTNGVLIDDRLAEAFVRLRVDEIAISMDSVQKEMYEELRVNAKYEDVLAAIDRLNRAKESAHSEYPRLSLTPNFMTVNIGELPDFIDFSAARGIETVQATPTQIYRPSWVDRSLLHHPDLTRRMAEEAERRAARLGVIFKNGLKMVYLNRGRGLKGFFSKKEETDFPTDPSECQKPWCSLYVEPDGEVRPCCYQSPVYGNLFKTDFADLWNGPQAQGLRRGMIDDDLPTSCRDCYEFRRHDAGVMIQV